MRHRSLFSSPTHRQALASSLGPLALSIATDLHTITRSLIDAVVHRRICQDNVCVINTALLMLMLADRAGELGLVMGRVGEGEGGDERRERLRTLLR